MSSTTSEWIGLITFALSIMGSLITIGWVTALWLSKKFTEVHDNIGEKVLQLEKNIISKLEYHERHDDDRFSQVDKSIWEIRVRNAARDRDLRESPAHTDF